MSHLPVERRALVTETARLLFRPVTPTFCTRKVLTVVCAAVISAASGDRIVSSSLAAALATSIGEPAATPDLSARELDVLRLAADGCTDAAIAARLFLSETTVKTHLKNASRKLQTRGRTESVARALRCGLIR